MEAREGRDSRFLARLDAAQRQPGPVRGEDQGADQNPLLPLAMHPIIMDPGANDQLTTAQLVTGL